MEYLYEIKYNFMIKNNMQESITYFDMQYVDFAKYMNQVEHYYSFNFSMIKLENDDYLYAVRVIRPLDDTIEVIPGNMLNCKQNYDLGLNYWWNQWDPHKFVSYTTFFVGSIQLKIKIHPQNKPTAYYNIRELVKNEYFLQLEDVRITKIRGYYYMYSSNTKLICELTIHDNNIVFKQLHSVLSPVNIQGINQVIIDIYTYQEIYDNLNIPLKGKKTIDVTRVVYIDWFKRNYLSIFATDIIDKNMFGRYGTTVKYDDYSITYINKIDGEGSYDNGEDIEYFGINYGVSPMLSFGCPCIQIDDYYLGVGHLKIHSDPKRFPYVKGSNIQNFRKYLYQDYKDYFGSRYIRHLGSGPPPNNCIGYIYMLYFYILSFPVGDNNEATMHISDAYLPLNIDDKHYKFSLFYPMGIVKDNDKILISCGEGDYYSVICKFDFNNILNMCKYNVRTIDFSDYNYYIIQNSSEGFVVDTRLKY